MLVEVLAGALPSPVVASGAPAAWSGPGCDGSAGGVAACWSTWKISGGEGGSGSMNGLYHAP
jgi:hypothetical protein